MKTIYKYRYKELIGLLVQARKRACMTQQQLADRLNKPQSYIAKIERCERKLDVLELVEICEVLEIRPSKIIKQIEIK